VALWTRSGAPRASSEASKQITIERTYDASIEDVWALWTTKERIEAWWAPGGFTVAVKQLALRPGGELVYEMTATAPEQIEFMQNQGMPTTTESPKTYTEVVPPERLAYMSLADSFRVLSRTSSRRWSTCIRAPGPSGRS
jgi:uncharacterized protein YndB with AHSA1/START domain